MFLTPAELRQLTGRSRIDCQRAWLEQNGWTFACNANGQPVVSRSYAERRLGGQVTPVQKMPNFDALKKAS